MFAYCGNNPVTNEDPTGKYIVHSPIMVNDGGGGLSSLERQQIAMLESRKSEKAKEVAEAIKESYGCNVVEYDIEVNNSIIDDVLIGGQSIGDAIGTYRLDSLFIDMGIDAAASRYTSLKITAPALIAICACLTFNSVVLPDGKYRVVLYDVIVTKTNRYYDGNNYVSKAHQQYAYYVMTESCDSIDQYALWDNPLYYESKHIQ